MAAPRASSFKALRNLQKAASSAPAKRNLHITGAQSSPRLIDVSSKNAYTGLGLQDLRNECRKRSLSPTGVKTELMDRLFEHDSLQARAFSVAMRRVASEQARKPTSSRVDAAPSRQFNTSRALKAVHDSSTMDFAYLPKLFLSDGDARQAAIRVPILPHIESDDAEAVLERYPELEAAAGGYQDTDGHQTVMKPQVVSVHETLAEGTHVEGIASHFSPMSDVHDGHSTEMSVDALTELTETVSKSAKRLVEMVQNEDEDEDTIRRVWNGFLDDLLGPGKSKAER